MEKLAYLILIMLIFGSCSVSKINFDFGKKTVFESDSSIFKDISGVRLNYKVLGGVVSLTNSLNPEKPLTLFLKVPANVEILTSIYTVFPGDHIVISYDDTAGVIFTSKGNVQRSQELNFQNLFFKLNRQLYPSFERRSANYPIDTLLMEETRLKSEIPDYKIKSEILLDSLSAVYKVSDIVRNATAYILKGMQNGSLLFLYQLNEQVLKENNLYEHKLIEILKADNKITDKDQIVLGYSYNQDRFAEIFCNINFRKLNSNRELKEAFNCINANYQNISKDYLLTKLIYNAVVKNVQITKAVKRKYFNTCRDDEYKLIIRQIFHQQKYFSKSKRDKKDNRLISEKDHEIYTIEEVIQQSKGKIIVIDFWASWCAPCIKQFPVNLELKKQYSKDEVRFVYISLDKEYLQWYNKTKEIDIESTDSFLIENMENSTFLKNNNLDAIPRYILIDKNGKIINDNAPGDDVNKFKFIIDAELRNK